MFVATLKNNFQTALMVLLSMSLLLWGISFKFVFVPITTHYHHLFYDALFFNIEYLFGKQVIILLSIVTGAFMINFLAISQEIISKNNYLPAFLYLLFGFSASTTHYIEPALIANLLLTPALYFIINSYRLEGTLTPFYNAGLFLGLALFFCTFYVFFIPVLFIALLITRSFVWREWLILLIGIITPIYLHMGFCYLNNEPIFIFFENLNQNLNNAQAPHFSEYHLVFLILIGFIFVLTLLHYFSKGFGNKIKTTKTKYIMLWLLIMGVAVSFYKQHSDMFFLPFIIPLSVLIGDYLAEIKQLKVANTLLFLILCGFAIIYAHALNVM